jgi:hypothetical protein
MSRGPQLRIGIQERTESLRISEYVEPFEVISMPLKFSSPSTHLAFENDSNRLRTSMIKEEKSQSQPPHIYQSGVRVVHHIKQKTCQTQVAPDSN